jgi:hypothetical protein
MRLPDNPLVSDLMAGPAVTIGVKPTDQLMSHDPGYFDRDPRGAMTASTIPGIFAPYRSRLAGAESAFVMPFAIIAS